MNDVAPPPPVSPKPFTAPDAQIWAWALGGIASHGLIGLYGQAGNILIVGFGLSAVMLGWSSMLPRVFDAFLDPLLGHLSDRTRTRWGRRKPFLMGATVSALRGPLMPSYPNGFCNLHPVVVVKSSHEPPARSRHPHQRGRMVNYLPRRPAALRVQKIAGTRPWPG